jgi:hypothetical protein
MQSLRHFESLIIIHNIHKVFSSNQVSLAQLGERQTEVSVTKSGGIVFDPRRGHPSCAWFARITRKLFLPVLWAWGEYVWDLHA